MAHNGDITSVTVCGVSCAFIVVSDSVLNVTVPIITYSGSACAVSITSASIGVSKTTYTLLPPGHISYVYPTPIPWSVASHIDIVGYNLGTGSDITSVSLCGHSLAYINQSATALRVYVPARAAGSASGALCDLLVQSALYGDTTLSNAVTLIGMS